MSNIWGNKIKYTIFGESHGNAIGIVIDGLEPGIELNLESITCEMKRRAPGTGKLVTTRAEKDKFEILSGLFNGKTTGTPLCAIIRNSDTHSKDYEETRDLLRPGHADFTGNVKYNGFNDYRGGGSFSGRLTAPIVFAGSIAKDILRKNNIIIGSRIQSIKDIKDDKIDSLSITQETLDYLHNMDFPVLGSEKKALMQQKIIDAKENMDSVGGVIECFALGVRSGLGDPFFDSFESSLSQLLFSIPAVKGVEFGLGFDITNLYGSQSNDEFYIENGKIKTYSNNNGGILGGITNGMPIVFRAAIKPTPSIAKPQRTVDISKNENSIIEIKGRHDPCILPRAIPVVEAAAAMCILNFI
ncbi:MAG: chorismate synthase [Clostridiaceae bacterium]